MVQQLREPARGDVLQRPRQVERQSRRVLEGDALAVVPRHCAPEAAARSPAGRSGWGWANGTARSGTVSCTGEAARAPKGCGGAASEVPAVVVTVDVFVSPPAVIVVVVVVVVIMIGAIDLYYDT